MRRLTQFYRRAKKGNFGENSSRFWPFSGQMTQVDKGIIQVGI
jgi:hypothetical protein